MAALYKMFSCQGGLNWIYGECTVKNVLLSRWFDLVRHGFGTDTSKSLPTCHKDLLFSKKYYFVLNWKHIKQLDIACSIDKMLLSRTVSFP